MTLLSRQSVQQFSESRALTLFAVGVAALVCVALVLLLRQAADAWRLAAVGFALGSFIQLLVLQLRLRRAFRRGEMAEVTSARVDRFDIDAPSGQTS